MRKYTFQIFGDVENITKENIIYGIKPISHVNNVHIKNIILYGDQDQDTFENILFPEIIKTIIKGTKAVTVSTNEEFITTKKENEKSIKITLLLV